MLTTGVADRIAMALYLVFGHFLLLVVLSVFGGAALLVAVTLLRMRRRTRREQQAAREAEQARLLPDGTPKPPTERGLCERCCLVRDEVYHLPTGERLCAACFEEVRAAPGPAPTA